MKLKPLKPGKRVTLRVPASTANLGPGFDCLGMALTLYNRTEVEILRGNLLEISVSGEGVNFLPRDETNILYKSFKCTFDLLGIKMPSIRISQNNEIPLARGLGSSASAIISGILAANALSGANLDTETMLTLALDFEKHPDNITPCLVGGLTVSHIIKNKVYFMKFNTPPKLKVVLLIPPLELSTEKSRDALPKMVKMQDAVFNISNTALLLTALFKGEFKLIPYVMQDSLHQSYREKLMPYMSDIFVAAINAGALGAALSGAGSSITALAVENTSKIETEMKNAAEKYGLVCRTFIADVDIMGPYVH